jgi:putative membrane protein
MMTLSIYIVQYFKDALIDKKLFLFLFLGIGVGILLQGLDIDSGNISMPYLFLSGILAFSFFLIPGISGSAMLVVLGVYGPIIQGIATFNLNLLAPFALGCLISLLLLPKLVLSIYSSKELNLMYVFSGLILSSGIFLI